MGLKFTTKAKRDELAARLADLAVQMQRSCDQGLHCQITVNDEMIGDIQFAACAVALAEYTDE